jgi:hypothetical protein
MLRCELSRRFFPHILPDLGDSLNRSDLDRDTDECLCAVLSEGVIQFPKRCDLMTFE